MRKKFGRLPRVELVALLGSLLAGCSSSPSIGSLVISPGDGTVFVGAAASATVRPAKLGWKSAAASHLDQPEDFASSTCGSLQYSAVATYTDGTVKDVSSQVSWSSSNSSAATIDSSGNATGVALGVTYIEADMGKVSSGGAPLYVDNLNSLAISPGNATLPIGSPTIPTTLQFSALGTFTQPNGTTNSRDITGLVTWSSTNPSVATISASGGLASSVSQGSTTIVATVCGISNTATLTVGPPGPTSLQISPANPTIAVGAAMPFSAVQLWSDGTTHPLPQGDTVQWSSSSTKSSIISSMTGVAFAVSPGTPTITATDSNLLTGTTILTVQAAAAQFAYVADLQGDGGTGSISSFTVSAVNGTLTPLATTAATAPQQVLLEPTGNFLYSIDSKSYVHVYQITTPTAATPAPAGTLTLLDNSTTYVPVLAGGGGKNIGVIDPSGQFLYVIDRTANTTGTLYGFHIQQSQSGATPFGSLQPISNGAPFSGTGFSFDKPSWVLTDRSGQFLYVVNSGNNTISGYMINFDGTLNPVTTGALPPTGNGPVYGTTDSQGHMYIANSLDNSVSAYLINGDGSWSAIGTLPVAGATAIINVLTDPSAQFIYALDQGGTSGGQVFAFNLIAPTAGTVFGTQIGQPQPVGSSPNGLAVDPSGVLLAVDNKGSNDISLFTIAKGSSVPNPGAITPATPSTAPTDVSPQFVVFYNGLPIQLN